VKLIKTKFLRNLLAVLTVLNSGVSHANEMMQVIVFCPSVYKVMAPADSLYYQNSYKTLQSMFAMEAAMAGVPVNYYIKKNLSSVANGKIENLDDFVNALTSNIKTELSEGKVTESQLEQIMGMCPLFWE
jgi:hypothetical protein